MSGDDLRRAAIIDDQRSLKEFLLNKPNVCSVDEFGLSSLHYAVWNGHVNCVKMLVMNPNGVNREGNRTSCLDLQSCVGYTGKDIVCYSGCVIIILFIIFSSSFGSFGLSSICCS